MTFSKKTLRVSDFNNLAGASEPETGLIVGAAFRAFERWAATYRATHEIGRQISICCQHIENARAIRRPLCPREVRMMLRDFLKLERLKSAVS